MKLDRANLIRAREMLGYGVEKTAEEAGVSKNSVLRAEHEEDIRPLTARKIAAALGVRVADLIGEPETLNPQAPPAQKELFDGDEQRKPQDVIVGMKPAELSAEGFPLSITVDRERVLTVLRKRGMSQEEAEATFRALLSA